MMKRLSNLISSLTLATFQSLASVSDDTIKYFIEPCPAMMHKEQTLFDQLLYLYLNTLAVIPLAFYYAKANDDSAHEQ